MLIFLYAPLIAISAYVFKEFLIQEGELLQFYGSFLNKIENDNIRKPLGGCLQCFSGQLALWSGLFFLKPNPFDLIILICLTIFSTILIDRFI